MFVPPVDVCCRFKNNVCLKCADAHARTNKRKQENQKRVYFYLETILVTALLLSTLKRPGMNWFPTHTNTHRRADVQRHLPAVNSNCINIKSQRPPSQGQTKAGEINMLCCVAAAEEMESGIVVVVCVQKKKIYSKNLKQTGLFY